MVAKRSVAHPTHSCKKQAKISLPFFVSLDDSEEFEKFYSMKNMPSILGSSTFKDDIREKFSGLINRQAFPESKVLALAAERVITSVCAHYKISREQLLLSKRGTENLPKRYCYLPRPPLLP